MLTRNVSRSISTAVTRSIARRSLHTPPTPPHAYLRPLVLDPTTPGSEELEGTMCLVLDRQEARNALSVRMVNELREGIAKTASTSSVLLLHTPYPGTFCAGADLRERKSMSESQVSTFLDSLRSMLDELEALSLPTIAVVDGFAMGGGTELALSCDLRVGGSNTKMALPETKLGIIPGAGGTQRLTRLVGISKAKELIFTGRRVEVDEAERIGLINVRAEERDTAFETAVLLSRQILTSAPLALRAAKTAINAAPELPLKEGLDLERKEYNTLLHTSDRLEGLRAFAEKCRAVFTGR